MSDEPLTPFSQVTHINATFMELARIDTMDPRAVDYIIRVYLAFIRILRPGWIPPEGN